MPHFKFGFITVWVLWVFFMGCEQETASVVAPPIAPGEPIAGVNFSQSHLLPETGVDLSDIRGNWISIIPQYYGRQGQTPISQRHNWATLIPQAIEQAQAAGLSIMMKPHVDFNESRVFRGDFSLQDEAEWEAFEQQYSQIVLELAELCESYGIEMLCIGTELRTFVLERAAYWEQLIQEVRSLYSGQLVYAANWDEYHLITFWDQLDYIGVNAYFPLSKTPVPTLDELHLGWIWYKDALERNAQSFQVPVLFTEYGYRSIEQATWKHWELGPGKVSNDVQAMGYEAFFQSFWDEPWVGGGFLWEWVPEPPKGDNTRWTPQGKPALEVIRLWYGK